MGSSDTVNRCRNQLTRGPKEQPIPEDKEGNSLLDTYEDLDQQKVPDQALDNAETQRMIQELVDGLSPEQRMSVLLYYYDERSVKEIAELMETSEGTVKSRLNYARKAIKTGVEEYEKQGIKLYGLSPLPFLLYFLRREAERTALDSGAVQAMVQSTLAAGGTAAAAGGAGAAAGGTAVSAGGASATAGGGAAAAANNQNGGGSRRPRAGCEGCGCGAGRDRGGGRRLYRHAHDLLRAPGAGCVRGFLPAGGDPKSGLRPGGATQGGDAGRIG